MAWKRNNAPKIQLSGEKEESRLKFCSFHKGLSVHQTEFLYVFSFVAVHARFWKLLPHWHSSWSLGNDGQSCECELERAGMWALLQHRQRFEYGGQLGRVDRCLWSCSLQKWPHVAAAGNDSAEILGPPRPGTCSSGDRFCFRRRDPPHPHRGSWAFGVGEFKRNTQDFTAQMMFLFKWLIEKKLKMDVYKLN